MRGDHYVLSPFIAVHLRLKSVLLFLYAPPWIFCFQDEPKKARTQPSGQVRGLGRDGAYPLVLTNCSMKSTRVFTLSTVTAL
jgi:hypothetical protein